LDWFVFRKTPVGKAASTNLSYPKTFGLRCLLQAPTPSIGIRSLALCSLNCFWY
jgi:hypothetical protein